MRIYLDSCVYQDIKNERNCTPEFLPLVLADKDNNIYCYSEAHIYDLIRDKTDIKFDDMKFIEQVADCNCYYYDKELQFKFVSPTQYYHRFDWKSVDIDLEDGPLFLLMKFLRLIPLDLTQHIDLEKIPSDCPPDFISILTKTYNMYDFWTSFINLSEDLTEDQKKFKELIRYLHQNSLASKIYESLGILGFDGQKLTDKKLFRETYLDFHSKLSLDKHMNRVFENMYNGLEFFGIVKGKPRKQQLTNMINDGRHCYFGAFCDIVVSSDEDFVRKASFLYDVFDIKVSVFLLKDFVHLLKNPALKSSLNSCLEVIRELDFEDMPKTTNDEGDYFVKVLNQKHYGFFNRLVFAPRENLNNFYFFRESENWSTGTMMKEVEYITNSLVGELGSDSENKGHFDSAEFKMDAWSGRTWQFPEAFIEVKYEDSQLFLRFGFLSF
jgi:hypothetical protein